MISRQIIRNFMTSAVRRSHEPEGVGNNIPFGIENKYKLTAGFIVFFGSGFVIPFYVALKQIKKM